MQIKLTVVVVVVVVVVVYLDNSYMLMYGQVILN